MILISLRINKIYFFLLLAFLTNSVKAQNWNEVQKVEASNKDASDFFGYDVGISGQYAVIGAPNAADMGGVLGSEGRAYIFEQDANKYWWEVQRIKAADRENWDHFGNAVAISGDVLFVAAPTEDDDINGGNSRSNAGSVYVFERNTLGEWNQVQKIVASDREEEDQFGYAIDMDGNYAIVGAIFESQNSSGKDTMPLSGSAYIFERNTLGQWQEVQKIVASDRDTGDQFGNSVSISGNYAIVGAHYDLNMPDPRGAAYIFKRDENGNWEEVQKLLAPSGSSAFPFGNAVAISNNYAVIGAHLTSYDTAIGVTLREAGSAYVYKKDESGLWNLEQELFPSIAGEEEQFGFSVDVHDNYAVIGALNNSPSGPLQSVGRIFMYERNDSTWIEVDRFSKSGSNNVTAFGHFVSIHDNYAITGDLLHDFRTSWGTTEDAAGAAYFFERSSYLGISGNDQKFSTLVYPNPTRGKINIDIADQTTPASLMIYNTVGQVIMKKTVSNAQQTDLHIPGPAGLYFLKITAGDKTVVKQLVKQ